MSIEEVKELLIPYLEAQGFKLYDCLFTQEANMRILRVLVDKVGGIDVDDLALVNNYLSAELDKIDQNEGVYMLEVSSPGAERELRNKEEISEAVGNYVYVNHNDRIYEGELLSFIDDVLVVRVNLKGRFKNFSLPYDGVKKIRLAIKF